MRIVYGADAYYPRISGQVTSIDSLKVFFEERGDEVYVFVPDYENRKNPDAERIYRFKSFLPFFTLSTEDRLVYKSEKKKIHRLLKDIRPDVIHIHTEFNLSKILIDYAKKYVVPLVATSHTHYEEYIKKYMPYLPNKLGRRIVKNGLREIHKKADAAIVPSSEMNSVIRSYGIDRELHIIPTGISIDEFANVDRKEERRSSFLFSTHPGLKNKKILLFVGRLGEEKNIAFLFDVLERLRSAYGFDDVELLLVGEGRYGKKLKQMVKDRNLEEVVHFTGYIDRDKLKHVYALADVFVFPSKTETQGLVTIESMATGTPVVGIGEMGTKDVMQGDNGGFMVSDDLEEFTGRTRMLLEDGALFQKKSKEAVEYSRKFDLHTVGQRTAEVYEQIISADRWERG
jgi:hypothetical protein